MAVFTKIKIMFEQFGVQLLSYFFHPFLQHEKERNEWIREAGENVDEEY